MSDAGPSDTPPTDDDVRELLRQGRTIDAIRALCERDGIELVDAKKRVDAMRREMRARGETLKRSGCTTATLLLLAIAWVAVGVLRVAST